VGQYLVDHLIEDGAEVLISDIFEDKIKIITDKHKVKVVDPNRIFEENFDIYAPCALGATLNDESIGQLKCSIVAGAANNQLKDEQVHAEELKDKGILYAPDFLINAGGIMNIDEEKDGYNESAAVKSVDGIYDRTIEVIENAMAEGINTHESAMALAKKRIEKAKANHSA